MCSDGFELCDVYHGLANDICETLGVNMDVAGIEIENDGDKYKIKMTIDATCHAKGGQ